MQDWRDRDLLSGVHDADTELVFRGGTPPESVSEFARLTANPQMLSFMIRWYREGLLTRTALAESAGLTPGALYELLITRRLSHGAPPGVLNGHSNKVVVRVRDVAGLCRFDAEDLTELAPYLPGMRQVPKEENIDLLG